MVGSFFVVWRTKTNVTSSSFSVRCRLIEWLKWTFFPHCKIFCIHVNNFSDNNWSHTVLPQPPPQALRFSHGRGERETSDWWYTARDHGKGTDGRRSAVSPVVSFPPSFARISRETSGYEAGLAYIFSINWHLSRNRICLAFSWSQGG